MENRRFWCEFLELYKSLPVLWKVKSAEYSNRIIKASAYDQVVEKLKELHPEADRALAVRKINNFRSNFRREQKKIKDSQKSGAGEDDIYESSLWYYNNLLFLEDQEECRHGMNTEDGNSEENTDGEIRERPKKRKKNDEDGLIKFALEKLKSNHGGSNDLINSWGKQYNDIGNLQQQTIARKIISDVLFHASMGTLETRHAMKIQEILSSRASTSSSVSSPLIFSSSTVTPPQQSPIDLNTTFSYPINYQSQNNSPFVCINADSNSLQEYYHNFIPE